MIKKLAASILAVCAIAFFIYYMLGGFDPIQFELHSEQFTIYGEKFEGSTESNELQTLFMNYRNLVNENSNLKLAVIDTPLNSEDSVKQVIGVISEIPQKGNNFDFNGPFIKTTLTSHPIVTPLPGTVRELAAIFAANNNLKLEESSIEVYSANGDLEVFYPIKN